MIKQMIKNMMIDIPENIIHFHLKQGEIRKFRDARRQKITSSINLSTEQMKQIDELYLENYGKKIPYTWHRHYTAFTNSFDPYYFPELIYIPEFQRYENLWPEYCKAFSDKNVINVIAKSVNVLTPKNYISCTKGVLKNENDEVIDNHEAVRLLYNLKKVFIKPTVDTSSGKGCMIADIINGYDKESNKSIEELIAGLGSDYCVQEVIECSEDIKRLHPESVNTFRVMTYRWKNDFCCAPVTMRIGSGKSYLDNVHSGGMCISIDNDGRLHEKAFTEMNSSFSVHPDTNIEFFNYQIRDFDKVLEAAVRIHKAIPQIGVIHWDFTIDKNGDPVLIEANMRNTSIQLIERPLGRGPFGERTPEILRWMKLMRTTRPHDRYKYSFGRGVY